VSERDAGVAPAVLPVPAIVSSVMGPRPSIGDASMEPRRPAARIAPTG
jgi:hypothetical protein